ncbi:MAG TPA: GNAT family N-acetyltransferase [Acidimicrobiales bacterium]|nr:GNAT family N-acetyltransferase [Acidimicrobiales bacterium]
MSDDLQLQIADNPSASQFEATVDGRVVALAAYELRPGRIVFTHTEVADDYEGKGVGSALVREALRQAAERGLQIVPRCPFVADYLRRHPEVLSAHAG